MKIRRSVFAAAAILTVAALFFRAPIQAAAAFVKVHPRYEDVKIGDATARIYLPASYRDGASGMRANLYLHGNGQSHSVFLGSRALEMIKGSGELLAVIDGQDSIAPPFDNAASGWGNRIYQQRYVDLYNYLRTRYRIAEDVDLIGESMGGLAMGHFIVARPFPIARAYGLGPVPSLQTIFDRGGDRRKLPIRNAFNMDLSGRDDGQLHRMARDAFWTDDLVLRKRELPPLKILAGSGDPVFSSEFGGEVAYSDLCTLYSKRGGDCTYRIVEGVGHAHYSMLPEILDEALQPPRSAMKIVATTEPAQPGT